jgi:hypothetical protein
MTLDSQPLLQPRTSNGVGDVEFFLFMFLISGYRCVCVCSGMSSRTIGRVHAVLDDLMPRQFLALCDSIRATGDIAGISLALVLGLLVFAE